MRCAIGVIREKAAKKLVIWVQSQRRTKDLRRVALLARPDWAGRWDSPIECNELLITRLDTNGKRDALVHKPDTCRVYGSYHL